ncbi:DUF4037 domain-containing protein [Sediminibacillus massiliensis]|uniref:DUF4037 domain-containing protein n=1 Tax=Sediminibacillus massiliensis TaxID=1926277 RepID=UPI003CCC2819
MQNAKVEGVLLGGSVSRGWQDKYSDIELFIFWKECPDDDDRKAPIQLSNGTILEFYPYEDQEWSETYITQGTKLEISNFLTDTVSEIIDEVTLQNDIDLEKQCLVAAVHDGIVLEGPEAINRLKQKTAVYPVELGKNMIIHNLDLGSKWSNRAALLARKDWLMLYEVVVSVQTKLMKILFGLNRTYVHHPSFKWQKYTLKEMELAPENASTRLTSVLLGHPEDSLKQMEEIIREVYLLVQNEWTDIDLSNAIEKSESLRPENYMAVREEGH